MELYKLRWLYILIITTSKNIYMNGWLCHQMFEFVQVTMLWFKGVPVVCSCRHTTVYLSFVGVCRPNFRVEVLQLHQHTQLFYSLTKAYSIWYIYSLLKKQGNTIRPPQSPTISQPYPTKKNTHSAYSIGNFVWGPTKNPPVKRQDGPSQLGLFLRADGGVWRNQNGVCWEPDWWKLKA